MRSPIGLGRKQGTESHNLILDPRTPWDSALAFVETKYSVGDTRTLLHRNGVFYGWNGTHYPEIDSETIRSQLYYFLDSADCITNGGTPLPFAPTSRRVTDVVDALKGATNLSSFHPPAWLSGVSNLSPSEIIACQNGLLHVPTRKLLAHTPNFFTLYALPYCYNPNAAGPREWLSFLSSIWGSDAEAIETLQEIFGYCLTFDTRQQKIFLLVGPKRSGKGTIAKVLTTLLGGENVAAPTLAAIGTNFGLAPLIDKPLGIIADARLSGRADQQVIAERLLSISGEDSLTIDRKYLPAWTGRLPTRILILTNELPRLADASGALASRFVTLVMTKSFYEQEDLGLASRLLAELPSILNWALEGGIAWNAAATLYPPHRLPKLHVNLKTLARPLAHFSATVAKSPRTKRRGRSLFSKMADLERHQGRDRPSTAQSFGRDLRAALPGLRVSQPRTGDKRQRVYEGVGIEAVNGGTRWHAIQSIVN